MSATFNEISARLSSKNTLVIMAKNINISNYYYIENNFDNLNSYSLYICKLSNLPKDFSPDKITNLLIIIDINDEYDLFQLKNCNILMLEQDKINLYKLLEDLQDVINVKANIIASSNSIISAISKNENINTLIDIIYDYLKNPIIIANAANYLCAYNTGDNKINDSIWQNYIINNYPDPNYLDKIYYDIKFLQSISKENNPHIIDYLDIMEHRILLCPIKINNLNMAYLYILEANKPFNRDDIKLVNTVNFKKFIPIGFLFLLNIVFYFFVRGKVEYKIAEPFYLAFLGWAVVYILYVKNLLTKFTTTPKILENFYNKILVKIYEKIAQVSDFIELNFLSNYKPVMLFAKCSVKISGWIEENIMNKSVKITVNSAKKLSEWGAKLQSRNVQTYNAYGFILLTIVITLIIIGYTMMFNQLS